MCIATLKVRKCKEQLKSINDMEFLRSLQAFQTLKIKILARNVFGALIAFPRTCLPINWRVGKFNYVYHGNSI